MKITSKSIIESLRKVNDITKELEDVLIDLLVGLLPFASSLAPAYFSVIHMIDVLDMFVPVAFIIGGVVEALGFAGLSQVIAIQEYNRQAGTARGMKTYQKRDLKPVYFSLAFYMVVIISINSFLAFVQEIGNDSAQFISLLFDFQIESIFVDYFGVIAKVVAIFLLSLLTIPGAITVAARTQHRHYLKQKQDEKKRPKRNQTQNSGNQDNNEDANDNVIITPKMKEFILYLDQNRLALRNKSKSVLAEETGLSRPTLDKYLKVFVENKIIELNSAKAITKIDMEYKQ